MDISANKLIGASSLFQAVTPSALPGAQPLSKTGEDIYDPFTAPALIRFADQTSLTGFQPGDKLNANLVRGLEITSPAFGPEGGTLRVSRSWWSIRATFVVNGQAHDWPVNSKVNSSPPAFALAPGSLKSKS